VGQVRALLSRDSTLSASAAELLRILECQLIGSRQCVTRPTSPPSTGRNGVCLTVQPVIYLRKALRPIRGSPCEWRFVYFGFTGSWE
jgi:hypothetical protein